MTFRRLTILGAVGAAALLIGCGIVFATRPGPGAAAAALVGMLGGVLVEMAGPVQSEGDPR